MHQIRVAQAEARAATTVSSEAVAQESLRKEWTRSGTPVPAIGENHVVLGTPIIGWGPLLGTPQAPPENPEGPTATVEGEVAEQPLENRNLENGEQGLLIPLEAHSVPEEGSPRE